MASFTEEELRRKRGIVGLLAIAGILSAGVLLISGQSDLLTSMLLRIGLLLGAFWLALPTKHRPAAWARVSPWSVAIVVIVAILLPRLKFYLPVLAGVLVIGWLVRPRRR